MSAGQWECPASYANIIILVCMQQKTFELVKSGPGPSAGAVGCKNRVAPRGRGEALKA